MKSSLTAYFGISKSNRDKLEAEVDRVRKVLKEHRIILEVFVDKYEFTSEEATEMMKIAFEEIDKCDFIIAELSKKAIGVGVEVGYAKAKQKPIIYLKREEASYSTTVGGSANYFIEYKDESDLETKLILVLNSLLQVFEKE